jgi:hypothetical protein
VSAIKPFFLGRNPCDTEKALKEFENFDRKWNHVPIYAYAPFDNACWDLKGKIADMPVYKMLGAAREEIPVYVSSGVFRYFVPPVYLTNFTLLSNVQYIWKLTTYDATYNSGPVNGFIPGSFGTQKVSYGGYQSGAVPPTAGTVNTGGGGGAGSGTPDADSRGAKPGGSGIVIARYSGTTQKATGGEISTSGGNTIHTFYSSGTRLSERNPFLYSR